MYGSRDRAGLSRLVISVALVGVLVVAGAYVFLANGSKTSTSSQSSSSSSTSLSSFSATTAVEQFVQDLNARNVDGLVNFYSKDAVDVWSGHTGGLSGQYAGTSSIKLIYATTVGKSNKLDANISDFAEKRVSPTQVNVTFMIQLVANSSVAGIVTATINVSQQWNLGSAGYHITKENWAYQLYDSTLIDAGLGSATTFPQWGYMLKGGNPNLVSEKSFEWNAGPYFAASVYAFLFGVVALLALRFRPSGGKVSAREQERR